MINEKRIVLPNFNCIKNKKTSTRSGKVIQSLTDQLLTQVLHVVFMLARKSKVWDHLVTLHKMN